MEEIKDNKDKKYGGLKYSVVIKAAAFILMCILAFTAVAGTWLGITMWQQGIYSTSREEIEMGRMENLTYVSGFNCLYLYLKDESGSPLDNCGLYENIEIEIISGLNYYASDGVGVKENLVPYEQTYKLGDFVSPYSTSTISDSVIEGSEIEAIIERAEEQVAASQQEEDFSYFINYEIKTIVYVDEDYKVIDNYFFLAKGLDIIYAVKDIIWWIVGLSALLAITIFVWLLTAVGYRRGEEHVVVCGTARIPYEIFVFLAMCPGAPALICGAELVVDGHYYGYMENVLWGLGCLSIAGMTGILVLFDFIVRYRTRTIFSSLLIVKMWKRIKGIEIGKKLNVRENSNRMAKIASKAGRGIVTIVPVMIGGIILYGIVAFIGLIMVYSYDSVIRLEIWIVANVLVAPIVLYLFYMFYKLRTACKELGKGNLAYKIDTKIFVAEFKEMGENLNTVATGMEQAMEAKIRSERMKTELISNVSHDIKTPLTSIVNYADLISKEETDNEKIQEYSQILLRQSDRLKRLTEDLVHASKVSSGNVEVQLAPCDIGVLLNQAVGEYQEKLENAKLQVVLKQSKDGAIITADGRHMWRVFDNLLNNICKYAQENTRVYLTVDKIENQLVVEFKNISRYELNISEEELMERFVRGDKSRHSDGNGLGLSIAKSLVEVQGGTMKLLIDGDLFKVVLTF